MLFLSFFTQSYHCFSTGVILTQVPYAQYTFHIISSFLQCRRSTNDVWKVSSFVYEKRRLKEMPNMIPIFIHWALGYTKQRHTGRKKGSGDGLCGHLFVHFVCVHLKGVGLLQRWTLRLDLSRQWHVHLRA